MTRATPTRAAASCTRACSTGSENGLTRRTAWVGLSGLLLTGLVGAGASRLARLQVELPALLIELQVPGASVVVLQDGALAGSVHGGRLAQEGGPVRADTVFEAASMSKPLFACLVMQAVQAGLLDLDRPVMQYAPELFRPAQPWQALITARMLLAHTSGLPNWRSNSNELLIGFEPGARFSYSGEGIFYLQRVLAHLTGEPLQALAQRLLFTPLGMRHSSFVMTPALRRLQARGHDEQGRALPISNYTEANAAYTLYTSAEDYARFLAALMQPERAELLRQMLTRQVVAASREPIERPGPAAQMAGEAVFWGLGWGINRTAQGDIAYHTGTNSTGFRAYCQLSLRRRSGLVVLCNGLNGNRLWQRLVAEIGDL